MQVQQLMTRPVLVCGPDDMLNVPARLMWDNAAGCVVVVNGENVVGVLTDRDICMGAYTTGQPLWSIPVHRCMATQPVVIGETARVEAAEELMQARKIRRLPVVGANGALLGIITLDDLAVEARRQSSRKQRDVSADGIALTLAVLGERRHAEVLVPSSTSPS